MGYHGANKNYHPDSEIRTWFYLILRDPGRVTIPDSSSPGLWHQGSPWEPCPVPVSYSSLPYTPLENTERQLQAGCL